MNEFPTSCDQCIPDKYIVTTVTEYELDIGSAAKTHWPKKLTAAHEISTSGSETSNQVRNVAIFGHSIVRDFCSS